MCIPSLRLSSSLLFLSSSFSLFSTPFLILITPLSSSFSTPPCYHHSVSSSISLLSSLYPPPLPRQPRGLLCVCARRELGKIWGINNMANKPPASCRGLGLLMWTEIEAGKPCSRIKRDRTDSGMKITNQHMEFCVYRCGKQAW